MAGPLVVWIVGALEERRGDGGLSALGAALYSIGIPKNSVLQYETQVKNGKLLLVAHGTPEEVERAKDSWIRPRRIQRRSMASNGHRWRVTRRDPRDRRFRSAADRNFQLKVNSQALAGGSK